MKLWHYATSGAIDKILETGLRVASRYSSMGSRLRNDVVYCWLHPGHDVMGHVQEEEYVCLELDVEEWRCMVANMDLISAAYSAQAGGRNRMSEKLVRAYDDSAVSPGDYAVGMFGAPEVLVKGKVEPDQIKICSGLGVEVSSERRDNLTHVGNYMSVHYDVDIFSSHGREKAENSRIINFAALHDDSTGLLKTYELSRVKRFITLPVSDGTELEYRHLDYKDLVRIWGIDRSEYVSDIYRYEHGTLIKRPVDRFFKGWSRDVITSLDLRLKRCFKNGGWFFGAFSGSDLKAVAALDIHKLEREHPTLQLLFFHVDCAYRGQGVGRKMFLKAMEKAASLGASRLYVSSCENTKTVDFYMSLGCRLTNPDPFLLAEEPEDIHMECDVKQVSAKGDGIDVVL